LSGECARIETEKKGPILVYRPEGHEEKDGVLIFLHGFNLGKAKTDWYVDQVWDEFDLMAKHDRSKSKATLVAIQTKHGRGKPIPWGDLEELLAKLEAEGYPEARKYVHVMGHSGAYANIKKWFGGLGMGSTGLMNHVTLLDGLYGYVKEYREFIVEYDMKFDLCVGRGGVTHRNAGTLVAKLPDYHVWTKMPELLLPRHESPVVYLPIKMPHMHWVTKSHAIELFAGRAQMIRDFDAARIERLSSWLNE
jgi:hypothetical protein